MRVCPTSLELDLARDTVPPTDHRLALWTPLVDTWKHSLLLEDGHRQ